MLRVCYFSFLGRHAVNVVASGVGSAMIQIVNVADRSLVFLPTMDGITPTSGSTEGGTTLTVTVSS